MRLRQSRLTDCHFADYAFSPTFNSAGSKRTPHPPIPQYPSILREVLLVIVRPTRGSSPKSRVYSDD